MQLLDTLPEGTTPLSSNRKTASATQNVFGGELGHFALHNSTLSTRSEGLTHPTLNFVPKGDVIRKEFCFADRESSRNFYDRRREKVYL